MVKLLAGEAPSLSTTPVHEPATGFAVSDRELREQFVEKIDWSHADPRRAPALPRLTQRADVRCVPERVADYTHRSTTASTIMKITLYRYSMLIAAFALLALAIFYFITYAGVVDAVSKSNDMSPFYRNSIRGLWLTFASQTLLFALAVLSRRIKAALDVA